MALFAAAQGSVAYIVQKFAAALIGDSDQSIRNWLPLIVLVLFFVRGTGVFLSTYCLGWIGRQVIKVLRIDVFRKYMSLPTRVMDQSSSGEMLSKLTYNIEQVAEATSNVVTVLIRDSLSILGMLGYMLYLSPVLTGLILVIAPVLALLFRFLSQVFRRHSSRIQNSMGAVSRIAEEALQSHRIIKIFNRQKYESDRFDVANEQNRRIHMRLFASKAGGDAATAMVAAFAMAGVIFFTNSDASKSIISGEEFVGFITAMAMLMRPVQSLTNVNVCLLYWMRITKLMKAPIELTVLKAK